MPKHVTLPLVFVAVLVTIAIIGVRARDRLSESRMPPPQPVVAVPDSTEVAQPAPPLAPTAVHVIPRPVVPPTAAAEREALDEEAIMQQLREMRQSDPELSLRLARQGNARFPSSPDAAERASIVVKSLMRMGRADEAKAEARAMVASYPGTAWAADVRRHMLDIPSYDRVSRGIGSSASNEPVP
jgi:hypothetical protein